MRYLPADSPWGINPSPEEIAIDTWLDNSDPYVSLRQPYERLRPKRAALEHVAPTAPLKAQA